MACQCMVTRRAEVLLCVNLLNSLDAGRRTHEIRQKVYGGEAPVTTPCPCVGLLLSCEKQLPCSARVPFKSAPSPSPSC